MLGGNQADQINFSPFQENEEIVEESITGKDGKSHIKKSKSDHLAFFMPTIYMDTYLKGPKVLPDVNPADANKECGIQINKKSKSSTT